MVMCSSDAVLPEMGMPNKNFEQKKTIQETIQFID